eukprot:TRINITY_DN43432_c0_g1_i1.p1 TRINITY_DN43432_c0_g1~~TRINITY_DN43432_c0_g1_i1.p1  ORF type:complete len:541 (-),score=103.61 TRINITY_DN43432_c0_g1_i1:34-1656(-)
MQFESKTPPPRMDSLQTGKPRPPPVETPMWKLQQGGRLPAPNIVGKTKEEIERERELDELAVAGNLFDAVSSSSSQDPAAKPLVRHVLIKDLRKVAKSLKLALPAGGLFAERAPVSLFAMFDGQSCAEDVSGPLAAEWCARNAHLKLLQNLAKLPPMMADEQRIKDAILKSFEDLDSDLLTSQTGILDGCGATVALMVGSRVFIAVLGQCGGLASSDLVSTGGHVHSLGSKQGRCSLPQEQAWLKKYDVPYFEKEGKTLIRGPSGTSTAVTRSLGDRAWKGKQGGVSDGPVLLRCTPEVAFFPLSWVGGQTPFVLFGSRPVMQRLSEEDLLRVLREFSMKPRAACGEIAALAAEAVPNDAAQCTAVAVFFRPSKAAEDAARGSDAMTKQPLAKKAKTSKDVQSARLRHILVKHGNCPLAYDVVRNKAVARTEAEAETIARGVLRELQMEARESKAPTDPKKAAAARLQPSPKFTQLCKKLSECATAQNGGGMIGDLGWLSEDKMASYGQNFFEVSKALQDGQWSDLVRTEHGVHILQKIA